jgi:hypothetical protein
MFVRTVALFVLYGFFEIFKEFSNKSIYLEISNFSTDNLSNLNLLGQILFNQAYLAEG